MRANEFLSEVAKKKGTCPNCSGGHKGGNYFDLTYDWGFDDPDYDENAPPKTFWVCRNCNHKIPTGAKKRKKVDELAFADSGIGRTPRNLEIDHNGMRVLMKPMTYLKLAAPLNPDNPEEREKIEWMKQQKQPFAQPWLTIEVPNEWRQYDLPPEQRFAKIGRVNGHEGRHRMWAQLESVGDTPIEVHIVLQSPSKEWRNSNWVNDHKNDYSQAVADALNRQLKNESGILLHGPFFHYEASEE